VIHAATVIHSVSIAANDIAYDPIHQRIYASVPSSAGASGNSLKMIDPNAAQVTASVAVGSEPRKIAVSSDGQYAYVGLDGAAAVRRVKLDDFTAGLQFPLGSDSFLGLFYVDDMEAVPGQPGAVAVSRRNQGFSPRHEGVAIYDNGVQRPNETPGHTGSDVIEFDASGKALYGYNNETTDFGFRTMSVDASGVQITNTASGLISGFGADIDYGGGKIVSTTGRVIDAVSHTLLGTLGGSGPVAVEADGTRAYFVNGSNINIYDLSTYLPLGSINVPGLSGGASLIRWGNDGLAIRSASTVYLINSSAVPEPAVLLAGCAAFICMRRRRRDTRLSGDHQS
jgi:DNA-binding beta-propeller fold protein YncE